MSCSKCMSLLTNHDVLHHTLTEHKYALPALRYRDINVSDKTTFEPPFSAEEPSFFIAMHYLLPRVFHHPEDVIETVLDSILSGNTCDSVITRDEVRQNLLDYGMPLKDIPKFVSDSNLHLVLHVHGNTPLAGFIDLGVKAHQAIYMRYNYESYYRAIFVEDTIQQGDLNDTLDKISFSIEELITAEAHQAFVAHPVAQDFSSTLTSHLTDILARIDTLKNLPKDFMMTLVASIVSSIMSIAASLVTLLSNECNLATYAMNGMSIVTSLTTFIWSIYNVCKYWNITFNADNVIAGIPELVQSFVKTEGKHANTCDFVGPAITGVVALLLGGIVAFSPAAIKDVVTGGSFLKATKEYSGSAQSIVKYITDDLCHLHLFGNKHHYNALTDLAKEGSTLVTTPTYRFFQDPSKICALRSFPSRVIDLSAKKISDRETSQALQSAKVMLQNTLTNIYEKIAAIDAVVDNKNRQECFAIFLAGTPGAGKSHFCMYVAQKIAAVMGYNPRVYNLQREGTFSLPYGGEVFGICNEFMNQRSENDDLLPRFNGIVSGDAYNFESAHLGGKVQPCMLKVLFLTSNIEAPNLTRTLVDEAASAVWSRCLRFAISDPKFEGRMGVNAHRKDDFSHLVIEQIMNPECITSNLIKKRITADQLIASALFQVARRELSFHKGHQVPLPIERSTYLTELVDKVRPIQANAGDKLGQSFFVIRLQGELDSGKSQLAGEIACMFENILPRHKVFILKSQDQLDTVSPKELGIYVIDDIVYAEQHNKYFNWINQGNPENIYIFATTDVYERQNVGFVSKIAGLLVPELYPKSYVLDTKAPEGIGRRLGLEGLIRIKTPHRTFDTHNPLHLCVTLTTHKGFRVTHENEGITKDNMKELIYSRYLAFMKATRQIMIVTEPFEGRMDHTVTIRTPNYTALIETLTNAKNLWLAYCNNYKTTTVRVEQSFAKTMLGKSFVRDWIVPEKINTDDEFIELARRMTAALRRADPAATCHIEFTETEKDLIYANNVIHWNVERQNISNFSVNEEGLLTCNARGYLIVITPEEYAALRTTGIISDNLARIPYLILQQMGAFYSKLPNSIKANYELALMKMGHKNLANGIMREQIYEYFKNNKVIMIASSLVALAGVAGIGCTIYRMFTNPEPTSVANATSDDEDGEFNKWTERMRKAVMTGSEQESQRIRDQIKGKGFEQRFNKWEYDWRSNTLKCLTLPRPTAELIYGLMKSDPHSQLQDYMRQHPAEVARIVAAKRNGMSEAEESHQLPTIMDTFVNRLNRMYFKITGPAGINYALSIGEGNVLTVSHIVNKVGETGTLSSDGGEYPVKCVAICRDRDLSVWTITSKTKPATPHLTRFLTDAKNFDNISRAWFVRPSNVKAVCAQADVTFIEHTISQRSDGDNPRYAPCEKLWDFTLINLKNMTQIIRRGDCGLPLVAIINNEAKIIGIHNAFSYIGDATYSAISTEDISMFMRNKIVSNSIKVGEEDFLAHPKDPDNEHFCTTPELREAILADWKPSKFSGTSALDVFGYSPTLHMHSNPKHTKRFIPIPGSVLRCEALPSAIEYNPKHVTDSSALVRDKYGKPHTLFTECVKYSLRSDTYGQWKPDLIEHTLRIIGLRIKSDYAPFKELNTKEVLNGLSKLQPFDLTTSAGPSFKLFHGIMNKEKLLQNKAPEGTKPYYDWRNNEFGDSLKHQYNKYVTAIRDGVPVFVLSKDNAKVELLPREKVHRGKVRLFNEIDFAVNMMLKKFFGFAANEIMLACMDSPYAMGSNMYILGTAIQRDFNTIEGEILSTDFKAMDKRLCKEMITWFCDAFLTYLPPKARRAMAKTLIYTLHTMNGHLYSVDNGNESGTFVTTMLNSFAVEVNLLYTVVETFFNEHKRLPNLKEIRDRIRYKILGDDATLKTSLDLCLDTMIANAKLFNMDLTPAKVVTNYPSFCSREVVPSEVHPHVWFARLKKCSITTCLFYFADTTPTQVAANVNVALFEASMWDREYFEQVLETCMILVRKHNCQDLFEGYTYEQYRRQISNYILGYASSPTLLAVGSHISDEELSTSPSETFTTLETLTRSNSINAIMDPVSILNVYVQKHLCKPMEWKDENVGTDHSPIWHSTLTFHDICKTIVTEATEPGKKSLARHVAAAACVAQLMAKIPNSDSEKSDIQTTEFQIITWRNHDQYHAEKRINGELVGSTKGNTRHRAERNLLETWGYSYPHDFMVETLREQVRVAIALAKDLDVSIVWVYVDRLYINYTPGDQTISPNETYYYRVDDKVLLLCDVVQKFKYSQLKPIYCHLGAVAHKHGIYIDVNVYSNTGNPMVEPSSVQQTAVNSQAATMPSMPNPQPTGQVPALAPVGENAISAVEGVQTQVLNPIGAPNMSAVGGVIFDIKTLAYTQFLDSDQEIQITDDAPSGAILLQIPYDPTSKYVNKYIREWVKCHERYTGALMFRITTVGNSLFSGYIGVSWQPHKINDTTMDISEFQKYAYDSKGVTLPWSEVHVLHDARKSDFYREVDDANVDERPHLVIALIVSIQNPLKEGVITRLRIASKLATIGEPNPFYAFMPRVPSVGIDSRFIRLTGLTGATSFLDFLPESRIGRFWVYTDGVYSLPDKRYETECFALMNNSIQGGLVGESNGIVATLGCTDANPRTSWEPTTAPKVIFPKKYGIFAISVTSNASPERAYDVAQAFKTVQQEPQLFDYWTKLNTNARWSSLRSLKWISSTYDLTQIDLYLGGYTQQACGRLKVITEEGIFIFTLIGCFADTAGTLSASQFVIHSWDSQISPLPSANIDSVHVGSNASATRLPLGYQALKITKQAPSAITIDGFMMPTANSNQVLLAIFRAKAEGMPRTQALQFTLNDNISARTVATIRYLQEANEFVINLPTDSAAYRVLGVDTKNLSFGNVLAVDRTNDFPVTTLTSWVPRTDGGYTRRADVFKSYGIPIQATTSNGASMAGAMAVSTAAGMVQGIGQGIAQGQQNSFNTSMLNAQIAHQKYMQEQAFAYGSKTQSAQFEHDQGMQGSMFEQQNKYQNTQYAHEINLQDQQHLFQQAMQQSGFGHDVNMSDLAHANRMTEMAAGSRNRMLERGMAVPSARMPGGGVLGR